MFYLDSSDGDSYFFTKAVRILMRTEVVFIPGTSETLSETWRAGRYLESCCLNLRL